MSWGLVKLGSVVANCNSERIPLKKADRANRSGKYRYFGASGVIDSIDDYLFDGEYLLIGEDGANLLARSTPIAFMVKGQFWVNNHAHVLKFNGKVDLSYLSYFINSINLESYITGSAQPKLNKAKLDSIEIPLPYPDDPEKSLKEQKRIAAILDKADGIRRKRQQAIQLADDFLRSVFLDMFGDPVTNPKGWEVKPLGESCSLQGGYAFKSKDYTDIGTPIVKITNVHFEDLDWSDVDYVPESFVASKSGFLLSTGDLVMAMTRPIIKSLGAVKVVEVKDSDLPCLLNQRVGRFIGYGSSFNRDFLKYFLYSSYFKNEVEKLCSVALQPNVSAKQIESIPAYLPSMELQNKFSGIVSEVKNASRSMAKADKVTFFEALSQKAFKGEL